MPPRWWYSMDPATSEPQNADTERCCYLYSIDKGISFLQFFCVCAYVKKTALTSPQHCLFLMVAKQPAHDSRERVWVEGSTSLLQHPLRASSDGSDNPQMPEVLGDDTLSYPTYTAQQSLPRHTMALNQRESSAKRSGTERSTLFLTWINHNRCLSGAVNREILSTPHSQTLIPLRCFGGSFKYKTY